MGLNYQKYINRLKQKRQDNPEYALYKQSMQAMAEPMKQMNRTMQGQMSMAGGSIGAIGSTYLQGQGAMQNLAMQSFGQADRAGIARNDAIDNQITQMEMTRDAEEERKKNELTKSLITGAATVGGFALGGLGGAILGGATNVFYPGFNLDNAMLGSQIGAGIGGIGSSFVGGADYNALQQSIGDTLAGISAISTLKTHKQFLDTFREKYQYMGEKDLELLITQYAMGDIPGMTATLNALQAPTADAEAIDTAEPVVADVANDPADPAVTVTEGAEPTQETQTTETRAGNLAETPGGGTGKTYKDWQAMVNNGDTSNATIKQRDVESYKERGYWYDAKGKKKTTKPDDYDKYYGTTAEQTPVVKPKEETNPPAFTEGDAAKASDEQLDEVISQAKYEKPESGVSAPTAEEINASVMDSHKTVSKAAFVAARKKVTNKTAYDAMFDYMEQNGLAYDSPAMKKWVEGKYKTAGTYNRFKKIYKAAIADPAVTVTEDAEPDAVTQAPSGNAKDSAPGDLARDSANFLQDLEAKLESMSNEELDNAYQQLKKIAAEGAAPRESATYGDSNAALGVKPGNYKVGKGQQFSRNTKTGELVVKVNGSYYKVRVNGNTIKVKVGDTVTVGADGKVEVK